MKKDLPFNTPPASVCILRLSALGDVCNLVPVVRTLQKYWPETRITWIIGRLESRLLGDIDGVEFLVYDKKSGLKGILQLRKKLAGRRFSVLLHMQAALRASMVSLAIPADMRLGFHRRMAKDFQWLFTGATTRDLNHPHVVDGFFSFLEAMGLDQRELRWDIPIPEAARRSARQLIEPAGCKYMVISPCSSDRFRNWRNWPARQYARLIDFAAGQYGVKTVLTGGPTDMEVDMGDRVVNSAAHPPVNLIGRTDIKQLLAIIEGSMAVVSPDSGPVHLANAAGVPPVGLYASSNPLRTGPYLHRNWVVNAYPEAVRHILGKSVNGVSWGKRVRDPGAISLVTFEAVRNKLENVFSERNSVK
ncbi:MAG: glycosyl transferase [Deltaproteobacteria bacterium]|nr:MAG: glycosyl transferase [Deltaproteobacteria bacterium]